MIEEPYYIRPESYLYLLKSHPSYNFCVGCSNNIQAIWSWEEIIWFNLSGEFLKVEPIDWASLVFPDEKLNLDVVFAKVTEYLRLRFRLEDHAISVKRFWLKNLEAGIEDVAEDMKEFLLNPDSFSDEEKADYDDVVEEWMSEGQFVFWWGQSFYVSADGFVETS